jgi:serine/threonine-protein kinase
LERLGGFQLVAHLGRGKSTEVYDAVRIATGARVAVRVIQQWIVARALNFDPAFLNRFREATVARSQARSAHLVAIDEVCDDDGVVFVVTELVAGRRLAESIGARFPCAATLSILEQLCDAVDALRAVGIVDCLPLPNKLYVVPHAGSEIVKLDTLFVDRPPSLEVKGARAGPPQLRYWSPQRLMGTPFDARDDVYALGTLGYELLTGRLPFADATNQANLITAVLKRDPTPASRHADVPPHIDDVLMTCLQREPSARYADLGVLRDALRAQTS